MARRRLGLAEERLVPFEATGNVADADDRPRAFHRSSAVGLTRIRPNGSVTGGAVTIGADDRPHNKIRPHFLLSFCARFGLYSLHATRSHVPIFDYHFF